MIRQHLIDALVKANSEYYKMILEDATSTEKVEEVVLPNYTISDNERIVYDTLKDSLPQLAPHLVFIASCILGRVSSTLVAPKASGKSWIMRLIFGSNIVTNPLSIDDLKNAKPLNMLSDKVSDTKIDDLSMLVYGSLRSSQILLILSSIIQRHQYVDPSLGVDIKNAYATFTSASTHISQKQIMEDPAWESSICDRILRYYPLYYNRPIPPRIVDEDDTLSLPNIPISSSATVNSDININELREILAGQISYERTDGFIRNILAGHARFVGRTKVTQEDVEWFKLYEPCLDIERLLISYSDKSRQFASNTYFVLHSLLKRNVGIKRLSQMTRLSETEAHILLREIADKIKIKIKGEDKVEMDGSPFVKKLRWLHAVYGGN